MYTSIKQNKKLLKGFANLSVETKLDLLEQLEVSSGEEISLKRLHRLLLSKATDVKLRSAACLLIQMAQNKKSIGVLLKAFNDEDENISHMAMLALSTIKSDRALEFMIEALQNSPNQHRRGKAAYVLQSYFGSERAVDALIDALDNKTQTTETRAQAAEGLGTLSATRATQILVANLDDPSLEVQAECVWALGQVGMDVATILKLERFLKDKSKVGITTMAQEASEAIKYIKARAKALEKYSGDKSTADVWSIHAETLELIDVMERMEETNKST